MNRGRTLVSTPPNLDPLASFIPEIWATETKEALDAMERMMSGLPRPPHRQRFSWWHRHFCESCKDYCREWDEAWKNMYQGKEFRIPQFVGLSDASIHDVEKIEWYEGEDIRMTDSLLLRAHDELLGEHASLCSEFGDEIPRGESYHPEKYCEVCDLLRDIDKSLEPDFECSPCDDCSICNKDCCSDCGIEEDGEPFCNCEDHSCPTVLNHTQFYIEI